MFSWSKESTADKKEATDATNKEESVIPFKV